MNIVNKLDEMLSSNRIKDVYVITRYMYRVGKPIISDAFYDKLHRFCVANGIAEEYTTRTYDDDPVPSELLRELGLEEIVPVNFEERAELYKLLDEEKSLSIEAITNYDDAYRFFERVRGQDLVFSVKVDGIFTKKLIHKNELKLGLSRGRSGNAFDLTDNVVKVVPRHYPTIESDKILKIYSEAYCKTESLELLRNKYDAGVSPENQKYKTEKSSAISLLRVSHDKEDYQHVKLLSFGADGLSTTISGTLEALRELGFEPVPYFVVKSDEVPYDRSIFDDWLRSQLEKMWNMSLTIPSDGVVVEVNDLHYAGEVKNQYSSRNIALKMEHWSFNYYPAVVKSIIVEQQRVECCCKVKIEPVFAKDGTKATIINVFNPGILIENGIKEGSRIYFERNSGAVNILIHGGRFEKLISEFENDRE